jgi:F-type H+-transporting ATPase subunit a
MGTLYEESAIESWIGGKWATITNQLATIVLTTITICVIAIIYNVKIRNYKEGEKLSGFLVIVDMIVSACEGLITSTLGNKYRKITPYIMYLMMYIFINAFFSLLGFEPGTTSYTVPLSMGLVTFFGIYYFGLKYQKLAYFKKFMNPLELLTQFVPLLSISFRLFGNMLGGSIILGLLYAFLIGAEASFGGFTLGHSMSEGTNQFQYWWSGFNFMTALILPWLHLYFDLFDGGMQAVVFTMLTLSYWGEAMGEEEEGHVVENHSSKDIKKRKKLEAKEAKRASKVAAQAAMA